jgi:hypothetical protein
MIPQYTIKSSNFVIPYGEKFFGFAELSQDYTLASKLRHTAVFNVTP